MIKTETHEVPNFLKELPEESDKILWKHAYARFLISIDKTPDQAVKKKTNLKALLPILADLEPRWSTVEPEMMVTSHAYLHRMNVFIKRYKLKTTDVAVLMEEIRALRDASADAEQTFNASRTDSENSDDEQVQAVQP